MVGYLGLVLYFGLRTYKYEQVRCEIIKFEMIDYEKFNLLYKYEVDGKEYFGDSFSGNLNNEGEYNVNKFNRQ